MSVSDFAVPALLVLIVGGLIWLVTKFEGGANNKYVSDFAFVTTSLGSLFFLPYADVIDAGFLITYAAAIFIFRFFKLRKAFNIQQTAVHLIITYLAVSRLNKVTGYGSYTDWLDVADYACFILLLMFIWHLYFQKVKWASFAAFLLFVPLTQLPLELVRNIWERKLYQHLFQHSPSNSSSSRI